MQLQTQIPLQQQSDSLIDYRSDIILLGSCFVENIGEKLDYFKFKNLQNPFGILFNPKAIETLVSRAVRGEQYNEEELFSHNEQWHCFDAHSKLSSASNDDLINNLNHTIKLTNQQIQSSTHIIVTLGTAWVYRFKKSNKLVANCHKVPQKQFDKLLLSIDAVVTSLKSIIDQVRAVNTEAHIIFTVSPVRHIKDGFVENTQSKAHLISAIHQLVNRKDVFYFPSYEIMMDELRDYRFYADDMLHPNAVAINYIWEKFQKVWIAAEAQKTMGLVNDIQKGLKHKPFHPNSEAYQKFILGIKEKQLQLKKEHPQIKF